MSTPGSTEQQASDRRFACGFVGTAATIHICLAVWVATRSLTTLVGAVPDDAFYYLQLARNMARGLGPTMDGISGTNGFQPAWLGLLAMLAHLTEHSDALLRVALSTALTLNFVTAFLIHRTLRWRLSEEWSLVAAGLWLLNPLSLFLAIQTVESSLYIACLACVTLLMTSIVATSSASSDVSTAKSAALGAALAAVVLGRSEGLAVALTCGTLFVTVRHGALTVRLRNAIAAAVGFVAILAPVAVWSWSSFGTLRQDSAAMKILWREQSPQITFLHGVAGVVRSQSGFGARSLVGALPWLVMGAVAVALAFRTAGSRRRKTANWTAAGLATAGAFATATGAASLPVHGNLAVVLIWAPLIASLAVARTVFGAGLVGSVTWCLVVACAAQTVVYGALFIDIQVWYLALPGFAIFLLVVSMMGGVVERASNGRALLFRTLPIVAGVAFLPALLQLVCSEVVEGTYVWQRDVFKALPSLQKYVTPDDRMGAFNSGVPSYFAPFAVSNLDGLVNHDVAALARDVHTDRFWRDRHISLVFDEDRSWARARLSMKREPRRTPLARFSAREGPDRFLWRIDWPAEIETDQ